LTPEDDFEALKDFNSQYEGDTSTDEEMALAFQKLLIDNPGYEETVNKLPRKMYSGKHASIRRGIFFCYELPIKRADGTWSEGDGQYRWYLVDPENDIVTDQTYEIWKSIECDDDESRIMSIGEEEFAAIRKKMESYLKKNYLRKVQAPISIRPHLITWMQLS
jgi:hypothetical protein